MILIADVLKNQLSRTPYVVNLHSGNEIFYSAIFTIEIKIGKKKSCDSEEIFKLM
jgi:hypothetical protein